MKINKGVFTTLFSSIFFIHLNACKETNTEAIEANGTSGALPVNNENYALAMSDMAMQKEFEQGANNSEWHHHRTPIKLTAQPAPMMNRDTLYSFSIVDGRGDVAITLPQTDGRYQSLHVWNHNHTTYKTFYGAGRYIIPKDISSDYFVANVRTQINASDPSDVAKANTYQDQLKLEFLNQYEPKPFQVSQWNMDDFAREHAKYVAIAQKEGVLGTMGTLENPVTTEDRNRGVSIATGLLPDEDAVYMTAQYQVDAGSPLKATYEVPELKDAKLGFYSITIYGSDQMLHTDKGSTISNTEIELNEDGKSFDIYYVAETDFDKYTNALVVPTETFWINYRIYLPSESVQNGEYVLPTPQAVEH